MSRSPPCTPATTRVVSAGGAEIGTGNRLQMVTSPGSSGASDVVAYAYAYAYAGNGTGTVVSTDDPDPDVPHISCGTLSAPRAGPAPTSTASVAS